MSEFVEQQAHFVQICAFSAFLAGPILDIIQEAAITFDDHPIFNFSVSYSLFFTAADKVITVISISLKVSLWLVYFSF